jgi:hypothetical protein
MMMNTVSQISTPQQKTRRLRSLSSKWWVAMGYPRKSALVDAIRNITNNAPLGVPLSKADEDFLLPILQNHADWDEKRGVGIQHIEIRLNINGTGSTRGIWIKRVDGTEIDISWVVALKEGGKTSPLEDLRTAAREAIQFQMHAAHITLPCELCDLCGEPMKRGDVLHADHIEPFDQIFKDFFGGLENDIEISNVGITTQIVDPKILEDWQKHHAERATLRLVHKQCNLKRKRI